MSGHSKWSTIKRKKAKTDAQKGRVFTRLIKEITVAARHGGGDENANPALRNAVLAARAANMPAMNIERAIKRGTGELPGVVYEEVLYEGYGPGGAALLMQCLTDNRNRTVSDLRHILTRHNGNLGEAGCVSWVFEKKGIISVPKNALTEDDLMLMVLDAGAEDISTEEDNFEITTAPEDLERVKKILIDNKVKIDSAELTMYPKNTVKIDGKDVESLLKLMDALDECEDIQNVYSNFDIDVKMMEKV